MRKIALVQLARNLLASERLRHAGIAILLAAIAAATTILRPLDITIWSLQSKLFDHQPSSEIVLVKLDEGAGTAANSAQNRQLLRAIGQLDVAGAERIILNLPIQRSDTASVDVLLRSKMVDLSEKIVVTKALREDFVRGASTAKSDLFFTSGLSAVSRDYKTDFLGYVWGIEATYSDGVETLPSLWTELAGTADLRREIYPDYSINSESIPQIEFGDLPKIVSEGGTSVAGKTVVVGTAGSIAQPVKIPSGGVVSPTLVHIVSAETAIRGSGQLLDWFVMVGLLGLTLITGLLACKQSPQRRYFYLLWTVSLVLLVFVTASIGMRAVFAGPLVMAAVYGGFRSVVNFKRRHLYVEPKSKLPNFVALQRDFGQSQRVDSIAIVIVKIARLDAIFATLSAAGQSRYVRQIGLRLTLGEADAVVYHDGGKHFAMLLDSADYPDLQGHLEGLRAIASQSVTVDGQTLDVAMTIGVDQSANASVSSRISSAIAAADQAREAYRPVFLISDFAADSEEWDHSLQARLEGALSDDRISIRLQPKVDMRSGLIVGAESLARWVDEQRGEISPARFITQCERVGRLDELTKRVVFKSLSAARTLESRGHLANISINVSAIQLIDNRIADLFEQSIFQFGTNPERLTIEVTETARFEDFAAARRVFEKLKGHGISFSMDDFGVASANFDALVELPFDEIKIDQMFVQRAEHSAMARSIVANIIRLADDAGLVSVAEGIENRPTYNLLNEMGCQIGQGFLIARPLPLAQLVEMLDLQSDSSILSLQRG